MNIPVRKFRHSACLLLVLTTTVVTLSLLSGVNAGIAVFSITPSSGSVGTTVQVMANITTLEGQFEVRFDEAVYASGNAVGNIVNASFVVPETTMGNHTVKITDVATGENDNKTFTVETSYSVGEVPQRIQEGDQAPIFLNITGGESGKTYVANVTVQNPNNASYTGVFNITTSTLGSGNTTVNYPSAFSSGANTSFVGNYEVAFNSTLDKKTFLVGLTDLTEYHRAQTVGIKAVYGSNENVTLTITGKNVQDSANLSDPTGLIAYNWTVPTNASIGSYKVEIISKTGPTTKNPPDIQNFTVPGFTVNVTTRNLALETVPYVNIKTYENNVSVSDNTTDLNGLVLLKLEPGSYTCEGHYKSAKVADRPLDVTGDNSTDLVCNLTNLRIQVVAIVNGSSVNIPEAKIFLTPENGTMYTDINGTAVAHSLLPDVAYTLNASRYNMPFNVTTISTLLVAGIPKDWFDVLIVCPMSTLHVKVARVEGQPIRDAVVKIQESLGGLYNDGITDENGTLDFNSAVGRYVVGVYDSRGLKLNESTVDIFPYQDQNLTIYCSLYGLTVSVVVVDYFGQPFSGVNVTLRREGLESTSFLTQPNGTASFENVVGGNVEVSVYLPGQTMPTVVQGYVVTNSTTETIKIEKYVILAGFLIETSQLAVAVMIMLAIVAVVLFEVYRMKRVKQQKNEI